MTPKDDVVRRARKIDAALSRDQVSFGELFTDSFMRRRTKFPSFLAMCDAAGARTPDELLAVAASVWEKLVAAHTSFASWEEMQQEAFAEWLKRQAGEP